MLLSLWEKRKLVREPRKVHQGMIHDAPCDALISQPKVEFPEMAHRVLFILPPDPLANCAKAALKPTLCHLQKPIICSTRLEASSEVHTLDLGELETTKESSQSDSTVENSGNPLADKFRTAAQPTQRFQPGGVRLVIDCWLLPGLVIDSPDRFLPFEDNTRLVACHSARLRAPVFDLICGRRERHKGVLGFSIGNQRVFTGTCLSVWGSRGGLMETNQISRSIYTSLKRVVRHIINSHEWYCQMVGIGMRNLLHSRDSRKM